MSLMLEGPVSTASGVLTQSFEENFTTGNIGNSFKSNNQATSIQAGSNDETISSDAESEKPVEISSNSLKKGKQTKDKSSVQFTYQGQLYDIDISFIIVNYKNVSFNLKDIRYNEWVSREVTFTYEYYKSLKDSNSVIIIDSNITKLSNSSSQARVGFTGIINEAMTCYMNSMLQTLNIINAFKKAVFQIPTQYDEYSSVALSLQRLFYDLMVDRSPVSTNKLIRSFGWGRDQIEIQHDVQEFNLLLSDIMEKKMAGTKSEGTFARLFEGKILNYIDCLDVNFSSSKEEKFCDLQLTVKGCNDIYKSFELYTEEETLDNENKYDAGSLGKQKARKGISFLQFPNVLILQLKRFEYNHKKDVMTKINDKFTYYEEINLSKFLHSSTKAKDDATYTLHSVVVHQGTATSGHYFAYIRCSMENKWMLFNDEVVKPADRYEVFEHCFGGVTTLHKHKGKGEILETFHINETSAYILVYIKNSKRSEILCPITNNDIPEYLNERFSYEKKAERKKKENKIRLQQNININLLSKEMIIGHRGIGVVNSLIDLDWDLPFCFNKIIKYMINFPKILCLIDLKNFISSITNIDKKNLFIFIYDNSNQDNLFRRNYYDVAYCNSTFDLKRFIDFKENVKSKYLSFIIIAKDDQRIFNLFSGNEDEKKKDYDYYLGTNDEIAFADKNLNNYSFNTSLSFKKDHEGFTCFDAEDPKDFKEDSYSLIFLKFMKYNSTFSKNKIDTLSYEEFPTFIITHVLLFHNSRIISDIESKIDILQLYKAYLPQEIVNSPHYSNSKINYYSEKVICESDNSYKYSFIEIDKDKSLSNQGISNNGVILIACLNFDEDIVNGIDIYTNATSDQDKLTQPTLTKSLLANMKITSDILNYTVYLSLYSHNRKTYILKMKKFHFFLTDSESLIKEKVFKILKENKETTIDMLIEECYYLVDGKIFTRDEIINQLTDTCIDLNIDRDMGLKHSSIFSNYPLLKFLNSRESRLDFHINIFPKLNHNEFIMLQLSLFDIDNNPLYRFFICLPKRMKKCFEILEFIKEPILYKFYKRDSVFRFMLQNPKFMFAYDLVTDSYFDLMKYEGKGDIEYRLQEMDPEEIDKPNKLKVFASFVHKDLPVCNPIITFVENTIKIGDLKEVLLEKMRKIKFLERFDIEDTNNVRYHTGRIEKQIFLCSMKNEEFLNNYCKESQANNIIVEFLNNKGF